MVEHRATGGSQKTMLSPHPMQTRFVLLLACALHLAAGAAPLGVDIAWMRQRGYPRTMFQLKSQIQQSSNLIANVTFGGTAMRPLLDSGSGIINTNGVGCFKTAPLTLRCSAAWCSTITLRRPPGPPARPTRWRRLASCGARRTHTTTAPEAKRWVGPGSACVTSRAQSHVS